jgi:hypothetical protein
VNIPQQPQAKAIYDALKDELKITFIIKGIGQAHTDAFKGVDKSFIVAIEKAKKKMQTVIK